MSETMRFDGRVAVVTGAGNGLGRAYALLLAERGATVLVNDLGGSIHGTGSDRGPALRTVAEIVDAGGVAEANFDSVATGPGGAAIVSQALETWGRVDIVVNNAGSVVSRGPIDENTDEQYQADLMVAAGGTFLPTAAARMTGLMGDTISAGMAKYYPPESAAPAVAYLAHEDAAVSGEMFAVGGDHMRRVFVGVTPGFQAEPGELSLEGIRDNLDAVMSTENYIVARNALDKVMLDPRVPWQDGVGSVF
jgi:hypothetical protein